MTEPITDEDRKRLVWACREGDSLACSHGLVLALDARLTAAEAALVDACEQRDERVSTDELAKCEQERRRWQKDANHWNGVVAQAQQERDRYRAALELIAAPKRPDGTYNRSREACEELAKKALEG